MWTGATTGKNSMNGTAIVALTGMRQGMVPSGDAEGERERRCERFQLLLIIQSVRIHDKHWD